MPASACHAATDLSEKPSQHNSHLPAGANLRELEARGLGCFAVTHALHQNSHVSINIALGCRNFARHFRFLQFCFLAVCIFLAFR